MGLGLRAPGGCERTPVVKYDARSGRIFRIDRTNACGQWASRPVEITRGFQAIFDLEAIETGWLAFPRGAAPDLRTAPVGQPLPARPSAEHRPGFRVRMLLGRTAGGDVREMASCAHAAIKGIDALYDAFLKRRGAHPGQLPVVALATTLPVPAPGREAAINHQPVWTITAWAARPAELAGPRAPAGES